MALVVQYLKDFREASDQLKEARMNILPFINVNEVFEALSDNSGRFIPFTNFNLFVTADCGASELFDEFSVHGDPGITIDGFKRLLGFSEDVKVMPRYKHMTFIDSLDICRTYLLSFCTLFYETEKIRREIVKSKRFVATSAFRHLRHSSLIPTSLAYSEFTSAIAGLAHVS